MYRSQIGCIHAPQTADVDVVDDDDDAVLELPVEVIVGDLWWLSLIGDDTLIFVIWFVCSIGVGLICVIIFVVSSTIPDEIDAFSFDILLCGGVWWIVEHFISMGTMAGVWYANRRRKNAIR